MNSFSSSVYVGNINDMIVSHDFQERDLLLVQ